MPPRWRHRPALGKHRGERRDRRGACLRRLSGPLLALAALALASGFVAENRIFAVPGGVGAWLPPGPALGQDVLTLAAPEGLVVAIYSHGSESEAQPDPCQPLRGQRSTTPKVVADLAGAQVQGRRVAVFAFCTGTKTGAFRNDGGGGPPKIMGRAQDLAQLAAALRARGVPPQQIFLIGHSAGAWASLMLESANPDGQNAVVALMPAFAGPRANRSPAWANLHAALAREVAAGRQARALVYASDGDPYERPEDLAFLGQMPDVETVVLGSVQVEGVACEPPDAHRLAFLSCFETQRDDILEFMGRALQR